MNAGRWRPATAWAVAAALLSAGAPVAAQGTREAEQMLADASLLLRNGDEAAALSKIERAAELAPTWPPPHASLGLLYQHQSQREAAIEEYARFQLLGLLDGGAEDCRLTREIAEAEALLVYLSNHERMKRGLPPLRPHVKLSAVARGHSREMCEKRYFGHGSPDPKRRSPADRFEIVFGYRPRCIAENVARRAWRPIWAFNLANVRESHEDLMTSTGHREAILWERPDHIGVGIAVDENGDYWVTENFALLGR